MAELTLHCGRILRFDEEDTDTVLAHHWHSVCTGKHAIPIYYAQTHLSKTKNEYLHRLLMAPPAGLIVDHANHDGLDNRRTNLRVITQASNLARKRTSGACGTSYRGIALDKSGKRWCARIRKDGKRLTLGSFSTPEEAAVAYDIAALEIHGEAAGLNFPLVVIT